jgi:acetamidase/formamidase
MTLRLIAVTLVAVAIATAAPRAETHRVMPTAYFDTYSAAHAPVLKLKSGDRVVTSTGEGLAQTGPFYIDGAEPGDLIVVSIEKLMPTRTTAMSASFLTTNAFDPGGLSNKSAAPVPWTIDAVRGVVTLDLKKVIPNVDWAARYSPPVYELPLKPVLGAIGVAPPKNEVVGASSAGAFGGNVDSAAIAAGARVMLPVYEPGALLFLGHGLARHGDGDVAGTGIETPLDVEFSVEVVKKREWPHSSVARSSTIAGEFPIEWPRVETADSLMAIGSAASLQQALQHATTELHHWLDDDFGFSERSLSIFLGPAIEYEIANVAGPTFTVVARVKKSSIPKITPAP